MELETRNSGRDGIGGLTELTTLCGLRRMLTIDTLVINITGGPSFLKSALLGVHRQRGDFIEWIRPSA